VSCCVINMFVNVEANVHLMEVHVNVGVMHVCHLQLLGPLPQFSQKRPASTSSRSTSLDFGSTLDDLLGEDDTFNTAGTSQFAGKCKP